LCDIEQPLHSPSGHPAQNTACFARDPLFHLARKLL
jgi:hypothetical protein